MWLLKKNKSKGLSLVELLLVVSVVSIIALAGFRFWDNQRTRVAVGQTVTILSQLSNSLRGALKFANQDLFDSTTLNTTALKNIGDTILGQKYKNGTIYTLPLGDMDLTYGGLLIPNPTINQTYGINVLLSKVSNKNCSLLVTSGLTNVYSQVSINGSVTMLLNKQLNPNDIGLLVAACNSSNDNNNIRYDIAMNDMFSSDDRGITQADAYVRQQESTAFLGNVTNAPFTGPNTCPVGASWDAATNKCGCPANSRWMGDSQGCVPFNSGGVTNPSRAGVCNLNDGLSQTLNKCDYLTPSIGIASGIYVNGKHIPQHDATNGVTGAGTIAANNVATPMINNPISIGSTTEEVGGRLIVAPALPIGNVYDSGCLLGTASGNRCAPPAAPTIGNW